MDRNEIVDLTQKIYEENKKEFDKIRIKTISITTFIILVCSIFSYMIAEYFYVEKLYKELIPSIIFGCVIIIILFIVGCSYYKFSTQYKNMLRDIINRFFEIKGLKFKYYKDPYTFQKEMDYTRNKHKDIIQEYKNVNFENKRIDGCEIKNYINGHYNNISVEFMDVNFYKIMYRSRLRNKSHIFSGNLMIIDKNIANNMKIISKNVKDLDSDNLEFDTFFELFPEDITENNLIDELKNFLIEFRKKYNIRVDIIFKNKIYIRFHTKKMFNLKLSGNPIDEESLYQLYAITKFIEGIVEIL